MVNMDPNGNFPFPIPISPNMPPNQQFSLSSLYPGLSFQSNASSPFSGSSPYKFSAAQYAHGGHIGLSHMARRIQEKGEDGDDVLAYINPEEAIELSQKFGGDINQETGLPQFGLLKKIRKGLRKIGISKILPAAGAIAGNYLMPGLGGIIGGGAAGAISKKKPLKGILQGAGMGALQGYGLPYIGKALSSSGMPQMGEALQHLGGSKFGAAWNAFSPAATASTAAETAAPAGISLGLSNALAQHQNRKGLDESINRAIDISNKSGQNFSDILEYLLLGIAGAGMLGGKTKYKIPKHLREEGSMEELMERARPKQRPEDKARYIPAYEPPEEFMEVPDIGEMHEPMAFKRGGHLTQLRTAAKKVKKKGERKDKILAHINKKEAKELDEMSGHDINKSTGLPQFGKAKHFFKKAKKEAKHALRSVGHVGESIPRGIYGGLRSTMKEIGHVGEKALHETEKGLSKVGHAGTKAVSYPLSAVLKPKIAKEYGPSYSELPEEASDPHFMANLLKQMGINPEEQRMRAAYLEYGNPSEDPYEDYYGSSGGLTDVINQLFNKKEVRKDIPAYEASAEMLEVPDIGRLHQPIPGEFRNFENLRLFKSGGYVEGDDGGQDDNVITKLPEGAYIIDATTVSLLGDGNSQAGRKHLDNLFEKYHHYAKGDHVTSSNREIDAAISAGEYEVSPHIVSALGNGDNNKGAKVLDRFRKNIRKHKRVKGLPPKSKPLSSYLRAA